MTLISLFSCFVICSSGFVLELTTIVMRRQAVVVGRTHRERVDVEPARGEQPRHAREHARLVLDEHGQRVEAHAIGASAGFLIGFRSLGSER